VANYLGFIFGHSLEVNASLEIGNEHFQSHVLFHHN